MSQRPRAPLEKLVLEPPPLAPVHSQSGEHAIAVPAQSQLRSGEYQATRLPGPDDVDVDVQVVVADAREVPRAARRLCDTVRIEGRQGAGVIHLVEGEVAWVSTHGFELPSFGRRLVERGLIEAHELDLVVALCRAEKLNFAEMLVQLELVGEDALYEAMQSHVGAHVRALLSMREISGSWERGSLAFTGELTVPLDDVLSLDELERWGIVIAHAGGALGERRGDERLPLHVIASVDTERGHVLMMTENVSRTGALLRSPCILAEGARVVVSFTAGERKLELPAVVVRFRQCSARAPQAIGVRWVDLTPEGNALLDKVLESL